MVDLLLDVVKHPFSSALCFFAGAACMVGIPAACGRIVSFVKKHTKRNRG